MKTFISEQEYNETMNRYGEAKKTYKDAVRARKIAKLVEKLKYIGLFVVMVTVAELIIMVMFSTWMAEMLSKIGG
jgi:cell division protein FtsL